MRVQELSSFNNKTMRYKMGNDYSKTTEVKQTSLNIYLTKEQKKILQSEAEKRTLSLSSFLKSTAFEKINREKS